MRPLLLLVMPAALAACVVVTPPVVLSGGSAPTSAEAACIAAVEGQTGRTGVTVRSSEAAGTQTRTTLDAPGAAAPWECVADESGEVRSVSYTGGQAGGAVAG